MISFGFAVYKFLVAVIEAEGVPLTAARAYGPRRLGLALIALGTISVTLGTVEYFAQMRRLNRVSPTEYRPMNFTLVLGVAVGFLGLFLFVTILANIELF
jgi:putative membrane protein